MSETPLQSLKENLDIVACIIGLAGPAAALAALGDAGQMFAERPAAATLVAIAAFFAGVLAHRAAFEWTRWGKARSEYRRKLEKARDIFSVMPARRKELVARMLDEGEVESTPFDPDLNTLCKQSIFMRSSSHAGSLSATYSMNPSAARVIFENREELLGGL